MENNTQSLTIQKRVGENKQLMIEQLKRLPIVQIACEKMGISRSSFYRWKNDDPEFAKAINQALREGKQFINEMAESQLLSAIKERNLTAIIFWLKYKVIPKQN